MLLNGFLLFTLSTNWNIVRVAIYSYRAQFIPHISVNSSKVSIGLLSGFLKIIYSLKSGVVGFNEKLPIQFLYVCFEKESQ